MTEQQIYREKVQKEAYEVAKTKERGTIIMPVRAGKTKVGLDIAKDYKKVLVGYPKNSIFNSWVNDSKKFKINIEHITFTTYLSLPKYNLNEYEACIFDEIHSVSDHKQDFISNYKTKMYALTGTPPIIGTKKSFLDTYLPIIYELKLENTVGILQKDYKIIVHLLEPSKIKDIPLKSGKYWSEQQKIQFWENKYNQSRNFNDMLKLIRVIQGSITKFNYLKKLSDKTDRGLIFVETKKQCDSLGLPSYYSGNKNSNLNLEQFQEGIIPKLCCISQLNEGITFLNLNTIIILHCYASNNRFHQRMARALNYTEGESAEIHLLCLDNTRDREWASKGLAEFDRTKISWIKN